MLPHPLVHTVARALVEERTARCLEAFAAGKAPARDCPLVRLAAWIASRRSAKLDPALLAR